MSAPWRHWVCASQCLLSELCGGETLCWWCWWEEGRVLGVGDGYQPCGAFVEEVVLGTLAVRCV